MGMYISLTSPEHNLEQSQVSKVITALAAKVFQFKSAGQLPAGPHIDITFMLSTALEKPEFGGLRMGGFTEQNQTLYFEVAVPLEMVYSDLATDYVKAIMFDVLDNSASYFEEINNTGFQSSSWHALLTKMLPDAANH